MDGCPRSKTWKVATNCRPLLHSLSHASTCTHSEHAPYAKCPYPAYFAVVVHQVVRSWVCSFMVGCTAYSHREIAILVKDVLKNIPSTVIPLNTTRTNVYDSREGRVRGLLFGASPYRGPQVAKAGFERKILLQRLHALASTSPIHTYSTIQLNHLQVGNQISLHIDGRNCGRSFTMSFGTFEGGKLMLHDPSKHAEGQYDVVSTYHRWVEVRPGQIHGVTMVTKGDWYSVVLFTPENLHARMSPESLDVLRQQGVPLNSQEFGMLANLDAEFHGHGKGNGSTPDRLKATPITRSTGGVPWIP
eukprot:6480976-Amphidinium_carterae.4